MGKINQSKFAEVKRLYYKNGLGMREISEAFNVSIDAVIYFMRRNGLKRRSFAEVNKIRFEKKKPSFEKRVNLNNNEKELRAVGAMLYWGEGYKSDKGSGVDFANSDPEMISIFLKFLRGIYKLNENRFRILLYCYADQNIKEIIHFWSKLTKIPIKQFTKPYIRNDFRKDGIRKMKHGLIHIRYSDKKLLISIKDLISFYKKKFG